MKDYKKILEGVVNIINTTEKSDIGFVNICNYIGENCPELKESKESKDERIKNELLSFLKEGKPYHCPNSVTRQEWAAWIEKQGKQKYSWSEEDERIYQSIMDDTVQENQLDDKQTD